MKFGTQHKHKFVIKNLTTSLFLMTLAKLCFFLEY